MFICFWCLKFQSFKLTKKFFFSIKVKSEDDFSIDMFDGDNHVRIRRSTDAQAVAGTTVAVQGENGVVALAEKAEKLNLNEAMGIYMFF